MDLSSVPPLTDSQVEAAFQQNVIRFPSIERLQVDPPIPRQDWALFSFKFLPKPVNGVYGFIKFRGAFPTEESWITHAKNIIKTVDSKNKIWPYPHGEWYPITNNEDYAKETLEVQQQEELANIFHQKESAEQKEAAQRVKNIKNREAKLIEESRRTKADTDSLEYHAQRVMHLQQTEQWLEAIRQKKRDLLKALKKCKEDISDVKSRHPEHTDELIDAEIAKMREEIGLEEGMALNGA
jgi:DNA-directed RNA polymerase beta' subunit